MPLFLPASKAISSHYEQPLSLNEAVLGLSNRVQVILQIWTPKLCSPMRTRNHIDLRGNPSENKNNKKHNKNRYAGCFICKEFLSSQICFHRVSKRFNERVANQVASLPIAINKAAGKAVQLCSGGFLECCSLLKPHKNSICGFGSLYKTEAATQQAKPNADRIQYQDIIHRK